MIFYQDPSVQILQGDVLEQLQTLPDSYVQTVVTSPPYWGLRDYGVDGQLGMETTPEEYVRKMVSVFREVRRVLKDEGTAWINLGDSYAAHSGQRKTTDKAGSKQVSNGGSIGAPSRHVADLKPKDLVGIPWRLAFALQADGWYLRQDIIWHKPNPMPESVTDRCTKAHEYLFLLSKSERYYYDHKAIKEPATGWNGSRFEDGNNLIVHPNVGENRSLGSKLAQADPLKNRAAVGQKMGRGAGWRDDPANTPESRNKRSVWTVPTQAYTEAHFATFPQKLIEPCILAGSRAGEIVLDPFSGSGTTCAVAKGFGRKGIGIELNPEYCALSVKRLSQVSESLAL